MADDAKGKDKGGKDKGKEKAPAGPVNNDKLAVYTGEIIGILLLVFFLAQLLSVAGNALNNRGYATNSPAINNVLSSIFYYLQSFLLFFTIASNILSVLFLMGIIYSVIRLNEIAAEQREEYSSEGPMPDIAGEAVSHTEGNYGWQRVQKHLNSDNPNDWRIAIIEADIILGDMLDKMSLPGETIGDKLKHVEKSDFTTIESAWEAHKVRNAIAHEGKDYVLGEREARRVIGLYQEVFEEFKLI